MLQVNPHSMQNNHVNRWTLNQDHRLDHRLELLSPMIYLYCTFTIDLLLGTPTAKGARYNTDFTLCSICQKNRENCLWKNKLLTTRFWNSQERCMVMDTILKSADALENWQVTTLNPRMHHGTEHAASTFNWMWREVGMGDPSVKHNTIQWCQIFSCEQVCHQLRSDHSVNNIV